MKMKQFRSILAIAVVAALVTAIVSPAQAFTRNAVKRGYENAPLSNSSEPQNNSEQPSRRVANRELQVSCVKANGSDSRGIGQDDSESMVSVGRNAIEVYSKVDIYKGSPYGETCSILEHHASEKVSLAFAIPDNSNLYNVRVNVYVNGKERISKIMSRGQARQYIVDITGANSYAYTLEPVDRNGGSIYFPLQYSHIKFIQINEKS